MPVVGLDVDRLELLLGDLLPEGVLPLVESCANDESSAVGGIRDQVHDRLVGAQRPTAPVDRDEREQTVLDLVPLARSGREVAHADSDVEFVGKPLQLILPDVRSIPVAAAPVGGDEDLARLRVSLRAGLLPPRFDRGAVGLR